MESALTPPFDLAASFTFIAQTFGSAVTALVLFGFYRQYRKSYLRHWTLGWTALAVYHFFNGITATLAFGLRIPPSDPTRLVAAVITGVSGYLQIGWVLFGVYALLYRPPVPII